MLLPVVVPTTHSDFYQWRKNFVGVSYQHPATNFEVFGLIDDLWMVSTVKIEILGLNMFAFL